MRVSRARLIRWPPAGAMDRAPFSLVGLSLSGSIVLGIPLGIGAGRPGWMSEIILGITGVVQTIPSLALLALLVSIPFLGIGPQTAIIALFLYGPPPIVRNTASGLQDIPAALCGESAQALDLSHAPG